MRPSGQGARGRHISAAEGISARVINPAALKRSSLFTRHFTNNCQHLKSLEGKFLAEPWGDVSCWTFSPRQEAAAAQSSPVQLKQPNRLPTTCSRTESSFGSQRRNVSADLSRVTCAMPKDALNKEWSRSVSQNDTN